LLKLREPAGLLVVDIEMNLDVGSQLPSKGDLGEISQGSQRLGIDSIERLDPLQVDVQLFVCLLGVLDLRRLPQDLQEPKKILLEGSLDFLAHGGSVLFSGSTS